MTNHEAVRRATEIFVAVGGGGSAETIERETIELYDAACAVEKLLAPFVVRVEDLDDLVEDLEDVADEEQFDYNTVVDGLARD